MIKKYFILLILSSISIYGQGEANNWFFGNGAGLHFDANGNVTSLPNGQIFTTEGCSSISSASGDLLFYTDGRTVWDRNHVKMPNGDYFAGRGLFGDPSSTQSGIIIPKPGNPDVYYIFTVDEPHHENAATYPNRNTAVTMDEDDGFNNGFNYSIVNLSVVGNNGSIGNVTTRNTHLITYDPNPNGEEIKYKCSEKITAVRDGSGGYWVITHFVNRFYAFRITSTGVGQTPVISTLDPVITTSGYRRNAIGYLKASPNGEKLAIAHSQNGSLTGGTENNGSVYLYDFDRNTGMVSNPLAVKTMVNPYGVEFSAQSKKLYATMRTDNGNVLMQFDLEQSNIPASGTVVGGIGSTGALQLGPNKKIYFSNVSSTTLGVINDPEESGFQCDFVPNGVTLANGFATLGLPPFITSVFNPSFQVANTCLGDTTTFTLPPSFLNQANSGTLTWDFGDGSPTSSVTEPTHVYATVGNYQVTLTITVNGESSSTAQNVMIQEVPNAFPATDLHLCDTDSDGQMAIDLQQQDNAILNGQSATTFEVRYFTSATDAASNTNAVNAAAFQNTTATFTIYARVQNRNNAACYALTDFDITVTPKPQIVSAADYVLCDDATANGIQMFTLPTRVAGILGTQNAADYNISFHLNQTQADTKSNPLPDNYTNTIPNDQEIFIRIENKINPNCYTTASMHLKVNALPVATPAILVQCDFGLNPDGLTTFNLTEANATLTNGNANLTTVFFNNATDEASNTNPLATSFTNTTNPQMLTVRVTDTTTGCYTTTTLELQVTLTPTQRFELNTCSDTAYAAFTLTDTGLEAPGTDVAYYATLTDALLEQNELNTTFTNTIPTTQFIYARIETNNDCNGLHEIKLNVRPLPPVANDFAPILCAHTSILLSAGIADATRYDFLWSNGATTPLLSVNTAGTYTVKVTDKVYGCSATRTITVIASDVAVITAVEVNDLSDNDNNTVAVYATGTSDHYVYALDDEEGPYQDSNFFANVEAGVHTVYVKDFHGCGTVKKRIAVLGIPKFFTPNGDGYNDLWRIKGATISPYKDAIVTIFDRYGKLVYQMKASGGWDGIYNREPLPSTDYWYVLVLPDGREVKGHFSLKR